MQGEEQKFEVKLPARITGLVFWGLVFIGLFVAVIILQQAESDLITENSEETRIIAYEIEEIVEKFSQPPVLERASGRIRAKITEYIDDFGFHAVRMYEGEQTLVMGSINDDDDVYTFTLHYYPLNSTELNTIELEIYCANSKAVISDIRKNFLLSIGIGVFVFGLLLGRLTYL